MPVGKKSRGAAVQRCREAKRRAGFRLVQFWVPGTKAAGFAEEARRQSAMRFRQDPASMQTGRPPSTRRSWSKARRRRYRRPSGRDCQVRPGLVVKSSFRRKEISSLLAVFLEIAG